MGTRAREDIQVVPAFLPVDISSTPVGDWVSLKEYGKVACVLLKDADGTAGEDPILTIEQAQDVSGTGVKALEFTEIAVKQAATNLLAVGVYTVVEQTASETYTDDEGAEQALQWIVEFNAEDLDVNNGFTSVRMSVSGGGTLAQLASGTYVLMEPKYQQAILPSAIVD